MSTHRMPNGRLMMNTHRQFRYSVSHPPSTGPRIGPSRPPAEKIVMALACFSGGLDRKSTRLNSSHLVISYAVFCLKKKTLIRSMHKGSKDFLPLFEDIFICYTGNYLEEQIHYC